MTARRFWPPLLVLTLAGCDWSLHRMQEQPRCDPLDFTPYLPNGMCNQHPPPGTITFTGLRAAEPPAPPPVATRPLLERGRDRFGVFCAPCHGHLGDGTSRVGKYMQLRPPPSLHIARLQAATDEHFVTVIGEGFGLMPSYGDLISEPERWAVTYYVRALQLSQDIGLAELPPAARQEVRAWLR